jgi:hypothetical protein
VSLRNRAVGLIKRYGAPVKFAARLVLRAILPGSPAVELVGQVLDCVHETAKNNHVLEPGRLPQASAGDRDRVEQMLAVLSDDLSALVGQVAALEGKPALAAQVLEAALATDDHCRKAVHRLDRLGRGFERLEQQNARLLDAQGYATGVIEELLPLMRRLAGVADFIDDLWAATASASAPQDQPQEVDITVPGWWSAQPLVEKGAAPTVIQTPRRVTVRPGHLYQLQVAPRATDAYLAGLPSLRRLGSLQGLTLRRCRQVTDASLAHLHGFSQLFFLDLRRCDRLTDAGLAPLRSLTALRSLDLRHCLGVTEAGLAQLRRLTSLRSLDLGYCLEVTDAALDHLGHLASLRSLDLANCWQVTDAGLASLGGLSALQALDLGNCDQVTDAGLAHVGHLTSLRSLDLGSCRQVTDAGLAHLHGLVGLCSLDLFGCDRVTEAGLTALRAAAPHCKIER